MTSLVKRSYLDEYLEKISEVPPELTRTLKYVGMLDHEAQGYMKRAESMVQKLQDLKARGETEEAERVAESIKSDLKKAREFAEERVGHVQKAYNTVDSTIRKLDEDLRKFKQELAAARAEQQQMVQQHSDRKGSTASGASTPAKGKGGRPSTPAPGSHKRGRSEDEEDARTKNCEEMSDMPVDPNEPRYCICQQVSFGEMVACDNKKCRYEWFHFQCVGLQTQPKGKWYCPQCRAQRKRMA
eukprot:m51a1_g3439 hypothetical protein (242) ;mRNA; f:651913-652983